MKMRVRITDAETLEFAMILAEASPALRAEIIAELWRVCELAGIRRPDREGIR